MEEDIEKYKRDCDLLELSDNELIEEAKATLICAMNSKSEGFRRPEKVALVAIKNLIARNKELEEEVENQDKTIDRLISEQEEREKYTHQLEKENQRRKAENKTLKGFVSAIFNETLEKNYIPKSKIKEKIGMKMQKNNNIIHDYKKKYGKDIYWYDDVRQAYAENYIYKEILQELLEENKNE